MAEILKTDWVHTGMEYPREWEPVIESISRRMCSSKRAILRQCLQIALPILSHQADELARIVASQSGGGPRAAAGSRPLPAGGNPGRVGPDGTKKRSGAGNSRGRGRGGHR